MDKSYAEDYYPEQQVYQKTIEVHVEPSVVPEQTPTVVLVESATAIIIAIVGYLTVRSMYKNRHKDD